MGVSELRTADSELGAVGSAAVARSGDREQPAARTTRATVITRLRNMIKSPE